jgi:hypothetical protein
MTTCRRRTRIDCDSSEKSGENLQFSIRIPRFPRKTASIFVNFTTRQIAQLLRAHATAAGQRGATFFACSRG